MGLTHVEATIANPGNPRKAAKLSFLVDSGAVYSVVPKAILRRLGIKPHSKRTFTLADGSHITRQVGDVSFKFNGQQGASPVIFGEKGDSTLLGTVSLEALGFFLDPIRRELRPLPFQRWARRLRISLPEAVRGSALAVCGKYADPEGASRVAMDHDRHLAEVYPR